MIEQLTNDLIIARQSGLELYNIIQSYHKVFNKILKTTDDERVKQMVKSIINEVE